jgi:hypothetical protein
MNKKMMFVFGMLLFTAAASAQSVVGSWKTISNVLEDITGKKKDLMTMQLKLYPCMAQLQTIFEANGHQIMKSPSKCGPFDYSKLAASEWKMNGNVISISNASMPTPLGNTATYKVEFQVNKAIFTHDYTDTERIKLHTPNAKRVIITYQRL